jgi:hypothetical protein
MLVVSRKAKVNGRIKVLKTSIKAIKDLNRKELSLDK